MKAKLILKQTVAAISKAARVLRAIRRAPRPLILAVCAAFLLAAAPARATIRYEVSVAHPAAHTFHVTMTIPEVHGSVVIQMPAWNTLYQIRDFGYHVIDLRVQGEAD